MSEDLWAFLKIKGSEPTNSAAEHALCPSVIQRRDRFIEGTVVATNPTGVRSAAATYLQTQLGCSTGSGMAGDQKRGDGASPRRYAALTDARTLTCLKTVVVRVVAR